ncbi:MAG: hypothetical protein Q8P25_04235, partial [Candidatus Curtissbacteria bacterium]|nr:hypothetical protein [Candidatus Curtissbacteria bacterium]
MSHAYLMVGGDESARLKKLSEFYCQKKPKCVFENDPDTHILTNDVSIKIEDVRNLEIKLSLKPYNFPPKVAVILEAEKLTFEAQGALLKLLEEPPGESILILTTKDAANLLPTIVSRCQIIFLAAQNQLSFKAHEKEEIKKFTLDILKSNSGQRLKLVEKITNRQEALLFVQKQLLFWHEVFLVSPSPSTSRILRQIQKTLKYL